MQQACGLVIGRGTCEWWACHSVWLRQWLKQRCQLQPVMSKLDFIVLAVPLFSLPRLLETIEKTIYVRKPPKGKNPYCAMILNEGGGGISKSFNTVRELALHIYDTFGDYWASSVRCKTQHQDLQQHLLLPLLLPHQPLYKPTSLRRKWREPKEEIACSELWQEPCQMLLTIGKSGVTLLLSMLRLRISRLKQCLEGTMKETWETEQQS